MASAQSPKREHAREHGCSLITTIQGVRGSRKGSTTAAMS
jgi:hypothetical protein